jgi:tripartite-type tricarboxylate transporter receptor subunit TctC
MTKWLAGLLLMPALATAILLADAVQAFPTRPVTILVPQPPGGANDALARAIAQKLQETWGQSVLVDFRPGGGVIVGTQALARSAPDGHTIGLVTSGHSLNQVLRKDLPYDSVKDFALVGRIGFYVMALVAVQGFEAGDVKALVAAAKAKPGAVQYASLGIGGATHLAGELLKLMASIDLLHVPYNGSAPAYRDMLGGRVPVAFVILNSALPHVRAGRLKVLGVTNPKRSTVYPEFPAIGESIPGYEITSWAGFAVPGATPKDVAQKVSTDLLKALQSAELRQKLTDYGLELAPLNAAEFDAFARSEAARFAVIARDTGFKLDQ